MEYGVRLHSVTYRRFIQAASSILRGFYQWRHMIKVAFYWQPWPKVAADHRLGGLHNLQAQKERFYDPTALHRDEGGAVVRRVRKRGQLEYLFIYSSLILKNCEGKFNSPTYFQSAPKRGQDSLLCRLDKVFKSNGIVKQKAVGEREIEAGRQHQRGICPCVVALERPATSSGSATGCHLLSTDCASAQTSPTVPQRGTTDKRREQLPSMPGLNSK
ncbi:hypothetical protein TNCV_2658471 [Trichonephila clavipes]|nr:hypothetical protein TNCV_2658471 [Trichonephila clavipes]